MSEPSPPVSALPIVATLHWQPYAVGGGYWRVSHCNINVTPEWPQGCLRDVCDHSTAVARIEALEAESAARLEQMQADRRQALVWRDEVEALRKAIERARASYPDWLAAPTCVQILREALSVNSASRDRHSSTAPIGS